MSTFNPDAVALTRTIGSAGLTRLYDSEHQGPWARNAAFTSIWERDCQWFKFIGPHCNRAIREAQPGEFVSESDATFAALKIMPPPLWVNVVKAGDRHIVTPIFRGTPPPCESVSWYSGQMAWGSTAPFFQEYAQARDNNSVENAVYELCLAGGYNKVEMVAFVQNLFALLAQQGNSSTGKVN